MQERTLTLPEPPPTDTSGYTACYPACALDPSATFPNKASADAYSTSYEIVGNGLLLADGVIGLGRWALGRLGIGAARGLGAFSQRTVGNFILQARSGLQGKTFVHEIKVLANASAKDATRADFASLAGTLTAEARAAGATAVEIRGVSVINPGILRLQGLAKDLGFTVKEVGSDFITFAKGL